MLKSASIERGRCYARVFTRMLEWKRRKRSLFMRMRCDRFVKNVFERIQKRVSKTENSLASMTVTLGL